MRIFWRCRVTVAVSLYLCVYFLSVCVSSGCVCVHLLAVCRCVSAVCVVFSNWRQALHSSFFHHQFLIYFWYFRFSAWQLAKGFSFAAPTTFAIPNQNWIMPAIAYRGSGKTDAS